MSVDTRTKGRQVDSYTVRRIDGHEMLLDPDLLKLPVELTITTGGLFGRKLTAAVDGLEQAEDPLGLEIRARLAIEVGEWEEARKYARKLGEADREGVAVLLAGQAAVGEKKWSKADARLPTAIDILGPYSTPRVAEIYREGDKAEEGLKLLRAWVEEEPELADARFDLVVTLCDSARERCPVPPLAKRVIHVGFDDPPELAKQARSEAEALDPYRRVRDEIRSFVKTLGDKGKKERKR